MDINTGQDVGAVARAAGTQSKVRPARGNAVPGAADGVGQTERCRWIGECVAEPFFFFLCSYIYIYILTNILRIEYASSYSSEYVYTKWGGSPDPPPV